MHDTLPRARKKGKIKGGNYHRLPGKVVSVTSGLECDTVGETSASALSSSSPELDR